MKKRKFKKPKLDPLLDGSLPNTEDVPKGFTDSFHNDMRTTVVLIDGTIYNLIESDLTIDYLKKQSPRDRPHVRLLSPIPIRTQYEQEMKNNNEEALHKLYKQTTGSGNKEKITSLRKAAKMGADVPGEVKRLLALKEKTKSKKELSKIRKQLRKLNYKRYAA